MGSILEVENLTVEFFANEKKFKAVDGISFSLDEGQIVGIVGESGSGKSVTLFSILNLLNQGQNASTQGSILFNKQNLLNLPDRKMRRIRGRSISIIFQEPGAALNPVMTAGAQVDEMLTVHERCPRKAAKLRTIEFFHRVGLSDPELRYRQYPHQLSGGMKQRVMIAMALICKPRILLADEPTTALDMTIQAQILNLLRSLQNEFKMSMILVSHDWGVISEMANHVLVMNHGRIVEQGSVHGLFHDTQHAYTRQLLEAIPKMKWSLKGHGSAESQGTE